MGKNAGNKSGYKSGLRKVRDVYYYKFKLDGRNYHGTTGLPDKDAALQFLLNLKEGIRGNKTGSPTFSEVASMYLRVNVDKAPKYLKRYLHSIKQWLNPLVGMVPVDKITLDNYARIKSNYLNTPDRNGRMHNDGGLHTTLIDFRTTMNFAVKADLIPKLPFKIELNKVQEKPVRALVKDQLAPFLQAVDAISQSEQVRLAIRVMLTMGLRISEVTGMRWTWFSTDFRSYTPGETKGREADALPVPNYLAAQFQEYKKGTQDHWVLADRPMPPWVFWGTDGNQRSISFVQSTIQHAAESIGLEGSWRPHRLRASCATILAQLGVSAHHIMRILRHKKLETTLRYVRAALVELRTSQARIADLAEGLVVVDPFSIPSATIVSPDAGNFHLNALGRGLSIEGLTCEGKGTNAADPDSASIEEVLNQFGVAPSLPPEPGGRRPEEKVLAVSRLLTGEDLEAVAKSLDVPPSTVLRWKEAFLQIGQSQVR